jgi:ATP-dependent helicase Lhr and Lhr-like helicase
MANATSSHFYQLHEQVQRWIWEQGWNELRDIQEQAIAPILSANTDLIIAAATAGGKTEAAFLPIFSRLVNTPNDGIQTLYLSPLKALINDQCQRLSELGERLDIPVFPWHGDIDSGKKQRALKHPTGILLMTPESLEALFVRRGHELVNIFAALQYVVIDELHSFIGTERGQQLRSLLHRLEQATQRRTPRIGLSATLGEMALAKDYLRSGESQSVQLIQSVEEGQEIKLQIRGYRKAAPDIFTDDINQDPEAEHSRDEIDIAKHLFKVLRGDKNLIFINRRQDVEQYADWLGRMCADLRVPNEFMPHHGSLSKELRESAEEALKERDRPANVICTSTLELGIDIGSVTSIAQVGTPFSVASTRQRLGRSGRRAGDPAILRIYVTEPEVSPQTPIEMTLHPALVQAIAIMQLLLQGWYEPPVVGRLHLSTFIQQFLSLIAQYSGVRAEQAWRILCEKGAFEAIDKTTFIKLLRCLGQQELIQQSSEGLLLLQLKGERLVNHYSFYTAFKTPEEFRITTVGQTLGSLPIDFPLIEGMLLIFAGKRWQILTVDRQQRVVDVKAAEAGRVPFFGGQPGLIHDRIRQEMYRIYCSAEVPAFLDATARDLLLEARRYFAMHQLTENYWVANERQTLIFPWRGSLVMNTLLAQLLARDLSVQQGAIALTVDLPIKDLHKHLKKLAAKPADAIALAATVSNKLNEKHDLLLDEELLCQNYAASYLDVQGAWETVQTMLGIV